MKRHTLRLGVENGGGRRGRGDTKRLKQGQTRHATDILTGVVNLKLKVSGVTHISISKTFRPQKRTGSVPTNFQSARFASASVGFSLFQLVSLWRCLVQKTFNSQATMSMELGCLFSVNSVDVC